MGIKLKKKDLLKQHIALKSKYYKLYDKYINQKPVSLRTIDIELDDVVIKWATEQANENGVSIDTIFGITLESIIEEMDV